MGNPEFTQSIDKLSSKLDNFSSALNKATNEIRLEETSVIDHKKLMQKIDQIMDQNEKLAQGIVEVIELLKRMQHPAPMPRPRPHPMPPRPMFQQQRPPMPPHQQPVRNVMHGTNLPPPPLPKQQTQKLKKPKKPKKSLSFFR